MNSYEIDLNSRKNKSNEINPVSKTRASLDIQNEKSIIMALGDGFSSNSINDIFDGSKFAGGFGDTRSYTPDYWTLRKRSEQLFHDNLYARGLIRRLVTNEINTGLTLEAIPNARMLGMSDDDLNEWSDNIEDRFGIWANNPQLCDFKGESTFGGLQRLKRTQAIISGDVLVVLRFDSRLKLPKVQIISGSKIKTQMGVTVRKGNTVKLGVEFDSSGRQVAYWTNEDGKAKRIPAFGEKSGRRLAWLEYGNDRLVDDVRGMPLFALIMQSLKELDRYRDAELRAAVVNSMVAAWVEKAEDKPGTRSFSSGGGAVRAGSSSNIDGESVDTIREFNMSAQIPGFVMEELQTGEKPHAYDTSRPNVNFGVFESAVAHALAWCNEVPPEIYLLAFNNNYSASRAAVNEFKLYLNKQRSIEADGFCKPVYHQWLIAETLAGRIQSPGLIDAWRDPLKYDVFGAWLSSDWGGAIKPSVDLKKEVAGYRDMNQLGWITNDRASKELTGTKFTKNIQRLKREEQLKSELLVAKIRPLLELEAEFGGEAVRSAMEKVGASAIDDGNIELVADNVIDLMQQNET